MVSDRGDFFGGGQRSLRDLVRGLRGVGVEPVVILPGPGPLASDLEADAIVWIGLPLPAVRFLAARSILRAVLQLAAAVRQQSLGLLHSDSPRSALYAGLAALLTRRPHVWHLRASRPSSALADRLLLRLCDAAVAVSGAAARRSAALRASSRVRVVPTGIPPIDFLDRRSARASLGLPPASFIAGVVGRVEADKGSTDAIAALAVLREAAPGSLLAFLGPEDRDHPWVHTCRLRAAAAGLSEAICFLGERAEAAPLLRAFDLILHPSRHEALPRSLIEALFAGVPVVAYAVGGVPEVIESGRSGLLVAPGDVRGLGAAAATLQSDNALRERLAAAGQRRARALFAVDPMVRRILAVYDDVIRRRKPDALSASEVTR